MKKVLSFGMVAAATLSFGACNKQSSEIQSDRMTQDVEEDLTDFDGRNALKIFETGFEQAQKHAKKLGFAELRYEGSGILARSLERRLNPIEVQTVLLVRKEGGEPEKIGEILPEKDHLRLLKSSAEVATEVKAMLKKAAQSGQPKEDLKNFDGENALKIFEAGFEQAKAHAISLGYAELRYEGTGVLARSLKRTLNPIEVQKILLVRKSGGKAVEIGQILPEKNHLRLLKSSAEVAKEIKAMIK